jgi:hypothetical protein
MTDHKKSEEVKAQELRESLAIAQARRTGSAVRYVDKDGCEVTAMPSGHTFYNAADWW